MSLNYGYWPQGSVPASGTCVQPFGSAQVGHMLLPHRSAEDGGDAGVIVLPDRFQANGSVKYCADVALGYDEFARAALETMRESYQPMPTGGVREFGAFFSARNYSYLEQEITRRSGYPMEKSQIMDVMITAYSMIHPRSDITDVERRTDFRPEVTKSYVDEMNAYVLDHTIEENIQANKQWDFYAKNRQGPSEFPEHLDTDTRTRLNGSMYAFDYWMPDD